MRDDTLELTEGQDALDTLIADDRPLIPQELTGIVAATLPALALAACGGGGSAASPSAAAPPAPPPPPRRCPADTGPVEPLSCADDDGVDKGRHRRSVDQRV